MPFSLVERLAGFGTGHHAAFEVQDDAVVTGRKGERDWLLAEYVPVEDGRVRWPC